MNVRDITRIMGHGVRLRCPRCGRAPLFGGWLTMHERCASCGMRFEREQGYFVGAIYLNYAFTVTVVVSGFLALDAWTGLTLTAQILLWSGFGIVVPLAFFRHSRSLWLSFEYLFNPEPMSR
jgi:uncharacterized protein (DUF983 family)